MIISHIRSRLAKQIRMCVYRFHNTSNHKQKLNILIGCIAGVQKIHTIICCNRPVIMLAGTTYPSIRLFVKKTAQIMLISNPFHCLHHQLIVINRNICSFINRGQFMLRRRNLIVLCLGCDPQFP